MIFHLQFSIQHSGLKNVKVWLKMFFGWKNTQQKQLSRHCEEHHYTYSNYNQEPWNLNIFIGALQKAEMTFFHDILKEILGNKVPWHENYQMFSLSFLCIVLFWNQKRHWHPSTLQGVLEPAGLQPHPEKMMQSCKEISASGLGLLYIPNVPIYSASTPFSILPELSSFVHTRGSLFFLVLCMLLW